MNKKYKEEMQKIHASEELIQNTINKINLKGKKSSYEIMKKIVLGTVAMMMISVTTYAVVNKGVIDLIKTKLIDQQGGEHTYEIPYIDIESEDAKKMNEEIKEKYLVHYNEAIKDMEEGYNITGEVYYKSYINGDVLSVVAYRTVHGWIDYATYNINVKTGKKVDNNELLEMKGLNKEEVRNEIVNFMAEKVSLGSYEDMTESEEKEHQQELLQKVYETVIDDNTQFYLNEENHLCIIAVEYVLAGAGEYERLYDLDKHNLVEKQYNY